MFNPEKSQKDWPNKIRDIIGVVSVVAVVLFLFAPPVVVRSLDMVEFSFLMSAVETANTKIDEKLEGGDFPVEPVVVLPKLPELVGDMADPEDFTAESIIVKDVETGKVLFGKNEYSFHSLASITKLMSALVLLDYNIDFSTTTSVIYDDIFDSHILGGEVFTAEELWSLSLVGSSNRAILTLVDLVDERENFVEKMNEKAQELGMFETFFVEPTGLDGGNISTASDIIHVLEEAMLHKKIRKTLLETEFIVSSRGKNAKKHKMWNTNWLLLGWIPSDFGEFIGGKTGYIPLSGYNFTMQVKGKNGKILSIAVLGAEVHEDRFTEARDIAYWTFENYEWPEEGVK
ncbi:MAG: hypothetical protein L3J07_02975 [Candidatus Magasanikbacteria bacterium]|nr:hypothetical protein [Candidatus Magasanikbacteria bacterium]